jgi:hypothetical protein
MLLSVKLVAFLILVAMTVQDDGMAEWLSEPRRCKPPLSDEGRESDREPSFCFRSHICTTCFRRDELHASLRNRRD